MRRIKGEGEERGGEMCVYMCRILLALQEFGMGGLYVLDLGYMALDGFDNEDISTTDLNYLIQKD